MAAGRTLTGGNSWGAECRGRAQHQPVPPSALLPWDFFVAQLTHKHLPLVVPGMLG